jgi:hypothetical protein
VALALPRGRVPVDLVALVERTLDLPPGEVVIRALTIDHLEFAVAVWPAQASLGDQAALVALADDLEGELLTQSSARDSRQPVGRRAERSLAAAPGAH